MIRNFRHRGLRDFFVRNDRSKLDAAMVERIRARLTSLEVATELRDLNVPGYDFHPLRGKPQRYSLHVNGPWCITFGWDDGDATGVDLEQYH